MGGPLNWLPFPPSCGAKPLDASGGWPSRPIIAEDKAGMT